MKGDPPPCFKSLSDLETKRPPTSQVTGTHQIWSNSCQKVAQEGEGAIRGLFVRMLMQHCPRRTTRLQRARPGKSQRCYLEAKSGFEMQMQAGPRTSVLGTTAARGWVTAAFKGWPITATPDIGILSSPASRGSCDGLASCPGCFSRLVSRGSWERLQLPHNPAPYRRL